MIKNWTCRVTKNYNLETDLNNDESQEEQIQAINEIVAKCEEQYVEQIHIDIMKKLEKLGYKSSFTISPFPKMPKVIKP